MGSERRTAAQGQGSGFRVGGARVAVCAGNPELAERIRQTLRMAGHELAGACVGLLELTDDLPLLRADAAVATVEPGPNAAPLGLLRRRSPRVPVILVVPSLGRPESDRLLSADIDGLVLTDEIERALVPALESVLADQLCVPSNARRVLAGPVFSHREKQVLSLLLAGLTNSEIASRLYLSESTVKSHLSSSFRKLGVSSRGEILRRARTADTALALPFSLDSGRGAPTPQPA
jgi:DNA-binding NarL/FixJ family response regulator